jgi:hypothetical protein
MEYGLLSYDVPVSERPLYNKLRKRIKSVCLPLNWSAYLIPWSMRDSVKAILAEISSQKPNVIESNVIKFDSSEEKELEAAAQRSLNRLMENTHKQVMKKLQESEKDHEDMKTHLDDLLKQKKRKTSDEEIEKARGFARENWVVASKRALKRAENAVKEGRSLAVIFQLSNQLEFAFESLHKLVDAERANFETKAGLSKVEAEEEIIEETQEVEA